MSSLDHNLRSGDSLLGLIELVVGLTGLAMSYSLLVGKHQNRKKIQIHVVILNMIHAILNLIGIGWILSQTWFTDWTQTLIPLYGGFLCINLIILRLLIREIRRI